MVEPLVWLKLFIHDTPPNCNVVLEKSNKSQLIGYKFSNVNVFTKVNLGRSQEMSSLFQKLLQLTELVNMRRWGMIKKF